MSHPTPARLRVLRLLGLASALLALAAGSATAGDWSRFRGPNGSGVADSQQAPPVEWGDAKNLKWKAELPGPGLSSPIVVGGRVFVTCWSGYGTDRRDLGAIENLRRHLVCLDRQTGRALWQKTIEPVLPEEPFRGMFAENGYASHTPASDGQAVYAFFGKTGVFAFDLDGNQLWRASVGTADDPRGWGTASSPVLYKNLVIVPATIEGRALVALDKATGKEVWKQEAEGLGSTWGTPVLVRVDDGRTDLVLAVPYEIWGLNPEDGKLRWYCESVDSDSMCSSVVAHGDVVYAVEGRSGGSVAVRVGGKGDVTNTHVLWTDRDRNRIGTPLHHDGRLYWVSGGIATCVDAKTGDQVYQSRIERSPERRADAGGNADSARNDGDQPRRGFGGGSGGGRGRGGFGGGFGGLGGQDYSSPVAAGDRMYYMTRGGDGVVIQLGEKFEQLATNRFDADTGEYSATPAISDGELFIRSTRNLYCVAAESDGK